MAIHFNPATTVGYARVSTRDQFTKGNALERYVENMIDAGITVYFTDIESGGSEDREGFKAVLVACRQWAKTIVVPDFTRFQRSVLTWEKVRPELIARGVEIRNLYTGEPLDFHTSDGIRQTQIKSADAEYIRNYAAEQAINGFERSRQKGFPFQAAAGLKKTKYKIKVNNLSKDARRLQINTDPYRDTGKTYQEVALEYVAIFLERRSLSAAVVEFCERYGYDRIGHRDLDFPRNHNSLKLWLQNPLLRGHQPYLTSGTGHRKSIFKEKHSEARVLYDNHEALFSPELARQIDDALSSCTVGQKACKPKNPLTGIVFCAGCGSGMFAHETKHRLATTGGIGVYNYMLCWGAYPLPGDPKICDRRGASGLTLPVLIEAVIAAIVTRAAEIAEWGAGAIESEGEPEEILRLEAEIDRLEKMADLDLETAIALKKNRLRALREDRRDGSKITSDLIEELTGAAGDPNFWRSLSVQRQREYFRHFVDRVEIDRGRVKVSLRC